MKTLKVNTRSQHEVLDVCILTSSIDKKGGGPSRSVPILAKGLSECGCQVTLLFVESNDMNLHLLDGSNVKIKMLPRNYTKEQFERELITEKYDLVHCQGIWLPFYHYAVSILRKADIPYIMTPEAAWNLIVCM